MKRIKYSKYVPDPAGGRNRLGALVGSGLDRFLLRGRQLDANDFVLVFRHGESSRVRVGARKTLRSSANLRGDRE